MNSKRDMKTMRYSVLLKKKGQRKWIRFRAIIVLISFLEVFNLDKSSLIKIMTQF